MPTSPNVTQGSSTEKKPRMFVAETDDMIVNLQQGIYIPGTQRIRRDQQITRVPPAEEVADT